jgi:hypothetical protein
MVPSNLPSDLIVGGAHCEVGERKLGEVGGKGNDSPRLSVPHAQGADPIQGVTLFE